MRLAVRGSDDIVLSDAVLGLSHSRSEVEDAHQHSDAVVEPHGMCSLMSRRESGSMPRSNAR